HKKAIIILQFDVFFFSAIQFPRASYELKPGNGKLPLDFHGKAHGSVHVADKYFLEYFLRLMLLFFLLVLGQNNCFRLQYHSSYSMFPPQMILLCFEEG